MELKIIGTDVEQKPIQFNYEELKTQITAKANLYKNMVYDDNQIKEAKDDKASLNKFKSALETKRRDVKKECLKPYEEFEKQVNDLISIIDEPVKLIDTQVKNYEAKEKQEKEVKIRKEFKEMGFPEFVKFEMLFNEKWLNKTTSMKKITEDLQAEKDRISTSIHTIEALPDFSFEAMEEFKRNLSLTSAIQEGQRLADIQKRKAEAEAERKRREAEEQERREELEKLKEQQAEPEQVEVEVVEEPQVIIHPASVKEEFEPKQWITFKAYVTIEQAGRIGDFCRDNGIELEV